MKISAEVTPEVAGDWKGYYARAVYVNDKFLQGGSRLGLVAAGSTPEEAIEYLKKEFEGCGKSLVEFEVENPKIQP